jgi:hypothetical protein
LVAVYPFSRGLVKPDFFNFYGIPATLLQEFQQNLRFIEIDKKPEPAIIQVYFFIPTYPRKLKANS